MTSLATEAGTHRSPPFLVGPGVRTTRPPSVVFADRFRVDVAELFGSHAPGRLVLPVGCVDLCAWQHGERDQHRRAWAGMSVPANLGPVNCVMSARLRTLPFFAANPSTVIRHRPAARSSSTRGAAACVGRTQLDRPVLDFTVGALHVQTHAWGFTHSVLVMVPINLTV
jgi:hypothetical protein